VRRGGCGDQVDEGDAQRVGEVIQTGEADVRLARLELDHGPAAETGAIREGGLAEFGGDPEAVHVRPDVRQYTRRLGGLHVHHCAP
jgi:hypothetical protein